MLCTGGRTIVNAGVSAYAGDNLPGHVFVGGQKQHVQGIAYDAEADCMYMSFTSRFLKVDMQGNILASIDRIQGHLGAMTFDPKDRKVYASLECKDDIIGQGIAKVLSVDVVKQSVFYIAIIDVDKLDKICADPEDGEILKTVCVRDACADYDAKVNVGGTDLEHRFGCSGIDGVAIAPAVGGGATKFSDARKLYLYVAYGIYGDLARKDNDYQVILKYDLASLAKWAKPVVFGQIHVSGPKKPAANTSSIPAIPTGESRIWHMTSPPAISSWLFTRARNRNIRTMTFMPSASTRSLSRLLLPACLISHRRHN